MPVVCSHPQFSVQAIVDKYQTSPMLSEPDHHVLQVQVKCAACGLPFEFLGMPVAADARDVTPDQAIIAPHRLTCMIPIRPGASRIFPVTGKR